MNQRPTLNDHPIHPLLQQRVSVRAYDRRPVEAETLWSIFEAARWSPSRDNGQPWRFIVATQSDPAAFAALLATLTEGNQRWVQNAPVLICALTKSLATHDHTRYDLGNAVGHMTVQAEALGLRLRQMAGFYAEKVRALYNIPAEFDPITLIALGYEAPLEVLPEAIQAKELRPRTRQPLHEMVLQAWGTPADWLPDSE
jgi:nitroreductase